MTLFSLPPRPTVNPWLDWRLGSIRHDLRELHGFCVEADLYESREGWAWAATFHRYELNVNSATLGGDPDEPGLLPVHRAKAGPCTCPDEATAREQAESWIRARVTG